MKTLRTASIFITIMLAVLLAGCGRQNEPLSQNGTAASGTRTTIVDMAGRQVTLPPEIKKVYTISPVETIFLYTIDPELLAGWSYYMAGPEVDYILPQYRNLPVLGAWTTFNNTASIEEIIKIKPDIVLMMKPINQAAIDQANEFQEVTKIPVVVLDSKTTRMEQAYQAAGKILNREERTAKLAAYCHETFTMLANGKPRLAGRKPTTVYYAEGPFGLESEPRGSWHAEVIDLVGAVNVVEPNVPSGGKLGRSPISPEQLLLWNPEVILIGFFHNGESSSFAQIMHDMGWQDIKAVRNKRVYEIPNYPFNWLDRPPGVNRLIGIRWLANLIYPDAYPLDFRSEVRRFYSLFYHYDLTDKETDQLLQRTQR